MLSRPVIAAFVVTQLAIGDVRADFSTIINVPPATIPTLVNSNTQVNVSGGTHTATFNFGNTAGTSTNVEVNITAGSVDGAINSNSGSVLNISGGDVLTTTDFGFTLTIKSGSVGNFSGGRVARLINVSGTVNISGGAVARGSFEVLAGGQANISGGLFGDSFGTRSGAVANIYGGNFRLNGVLINGLNTPGNILPFNLPAGGTLSGNLSDGSPLILSTQDSDRIADGTIKLHAARAANYRPRHNHRFHGSYSRLHPRRTDANRG